MVFFAPYLRHLHSICFGMLLLEQHEWAGLNGARVLSSFSFNRDSPPLNVLKNIPLMRLELSCDDKDCALLDSSLSGIPTLRACNLERLSSGERYASSYFAPIPRMLKDVTDTGFFHDIHLFKKLIGTRVTKKHVAFMTYFHDYFSVYNLVNLRRRGYKG